MAKSAETMEKIVALCKRRGFIFGSSEIYGGIAGFWDYGPLGTELKRNVKEAWWQDMVRNPPVGPGGVEFQMVGLDCSIIMNPKVWEASGHVGGFQDPMQTCRQCKKHLRSDQVWEGVKESEWAKSLGELYRTLDTVTGVDLKKWAQKKGRKLAPGLALVRNPDVTLSWLSERIEETGPAIDPIALLQHVATEQLAKTGLATPCPHCGGDLTEPRDFNLMF